MAELSVESRVGLMVDEMVAVMDTLQAGQLVGWMAFWSAVVMVVM